MSNLKKEKLDASPMVTQTPPLPTELPAPNRYAEREELKGEVNVFRTIEKKFKLKGDPAGRKNKRKMAQSGDHGRNDVEPGYWKRGIYNSVIDPRYVLEDANTETKECLELVSEEKRDVVLPDGSVKSHSFRVFRVKDTAGLLVLEGVLTPSEQLKWAHKCVSKYSNAHHTNLTNLHGPQPDAWEGKDTIRLCLFPHLLVSSFILFILYLHITHFPSFPHTNPVLPQQPSCPERRSFPSFLSCGGHVWATITIGRVGHMTPQTRLLSLTIWLVS